MRACANNDGDSVDDNGADDNNDGADGCQKPSSFVAPEGVAQGEMHVARADIDNGGVLSCGITLTDDGGRDVVLPSLSQRKIFGDGVSSSTDAEGA